MKFLVIPIAIVLILYVNQYNQLPTEFLEFSDHLTRIQARHNHMVKLILEESNHRERRQFAYQYLEQATHWIDIIEDCSVDLKARSKGYTMRVKSKISAKIYISKRLLFTIRESRLMFQNALQGIAEERHMKLLEYEPNRPYRKLFKNIEKK